LVHALVPLEAHARVRQLVDGCLDVIDLEVGEDAVLLRRLDAQGLAVELPGRVDVVDRESAESPGVLEPDVLLPVGSMG
jgi:hypothetical protein